MGLDQIHGWQLRILKEQEKSGTHSEIEQGTAKQHTTMYRRNFMKLIVAFILVIFCSSTINKDKNAIDFGQRSFHDGSIPTESLKTDSLDLLSLIRDDNEVLGIY